MISLQVIEILNTGMYGQRTCRAMLQLPDDVRCVKKGDCLVLRELNEDGKIIREHEFDKEGCYTGTQQFGGAIEQIQNP